MALINLTPHTVILELNKRRHVLPSQGNARVRHRNWHFVQNADGWPVFEPVGSYIQGLPDPKPGIFYIVSGIVLNYLPPGRMDCVAPDTFQGSVKRDRNGLVISVQGFVINEQRVE